QACHLVFLLDVAAVFTPFTVEQFTTFSSEVEKMASSDLRLWLLVAAAPAVLGDGIGMIGFGKTMYQPPCAFACRSVIDSSTLLCTPAHDPNSAAGGHHAPPKTPESCFASDAAFAQTLALCIDTYCPGSDAPRVGAIEEYWVSHLAAGSIGSFAWVPALTYQEALQRARRDERSSSRNGTAAAEGHAAGHARRAVVYARHGGHGEEEDHDATPVNTSLPVVRPGAPLNVTSFVRASDWRKNYNGLKSFEINEVGHVKYTIIITVVPFLLAIAASLPRFIPALTRATSWAWTEVVKPYWIWGVVATLAAVLLWPASVLAVRKRFYEVFLSVHHVLVALFLVGYFYHIFYRYSFNWGYEIWCYIAGGIWATERLARLVRMLLMGRRTADVSVIPGSDGEYLRVDIDGAHARGLVYLYFPTLSWRFWENHPFSVASSFAIRDSAGDSSTDTQSSQEKSLEEKELGANIETKPAPQPRKTVFAPVADHRISILVRVQSGMTARLAAKVAAGGSRVRLPVVVEGRYHAASATELSQCTSIICIAGGVGVSAVLPILREQSCRRRLCWGVRNQSVVDECRKDILSLPAAVQVETSIGHRLDIASILKEELLSRTGERGPTGIVVCGPPEMADDVRNEVTRLARSGSLARGVVLLDEAFTW
ncbi:hypothetical protein LLEC1_07258, partial [Akanthomyces lecanii]